ncbi:MAG: DNA repair protein RecN [candidate division Zixibacteria bacterium]|nr:DNA repair protein RecN [candidate division Zixibacteria bacterium]
MLRRLKIQNFALVDDLELKFDRGLSALTGETGAGKSVIVTALGLVLGDRADREHIRHGCTRAFVEAEFTIEGMTQRYRTDFAEYIKGQRLTISREVSRDGNSKVRVNGNVATLARLKELTTPLAEILGQHSNRLLLDEDNHMLFLDSFASSIDLCGEVGQLFTTWDKSAAELRRTLRRRDDLERERELLLFQQREICDADIRIGEEDEINNERRILDSSRTLIESASLIESQFGGDKSGVIDSLRVARKELDRMAAIDPKLQEQVKQLEDVDFQLEELRSFVEKYGSSVPDDPNRLEEINQRLDEIYQLKQKYGGSEASTLQALEDIDAKLTDCPDTSALIQRLETQEASDRTAYTKQALQLSEVRRKAAKYLQKLVVKEMSELAIDHGQFDSEFIYEEIADGVEIRGQKVRPHAYGLESCRFLFSANPGEPLKSLVKTASGGEISRLLLALKAAEKKNNRMSHSLMVFDEVDAGIGGQTAIDVGRKIKKISESSQVIVITHLHQIARLADYHYLAVKTGTASKRVTIRVSRLEGPSIERELDRMVALPED